MSSDIDLLLELESELIKQKRIVYFNSAKTEMMIRCVYCGDSAKDETHAHMYISTSSPFQFFCQRCNEKGMLTSKTLHDIGCDDVSGLGREFDKSIRHKLKDTSIRLNRTGDAFSSVASKIVLPKINEGFKYFEKKVIYLEDRFDVDLDIPDLERMKVIFNYKKFIKDNNLKNLIKRTEDQYFYNSLINHIQKNSIGFSSTDGNYNIIRHITPFCTKQEPKGRRYHNDNMNYPYEVGDKTYTIANNINVLSDTLNLVLTEGIFDINSVFLNLYDRKQNDNTLFMAVNGKAFNLPILNLRRLGFLKINLDIYSDNDVHKKVYDRILNKDHFTNIRIHYNEKGNEKDFGVAKSKIKDKVIILK